MATILMVLAAYYVVVAILVALLNASAKEPNLLSWRSRIVEPISAPILAPLMILWLIFSFARKQPQDWAAGIKQARTFD